MTRDKAYEGGAPNFAFGGRGVLGILSLLFVFAIPLNEVQVLPARSAAALLGVLVIIAWIIDVVRGRTDSRPRPATQMWLLVTATSMMAWYLVGSTWSLNSGESLSLLLQQLLPLLLLAVGLAQGFGRMGEEPVKAFALSSGIMGVYTVGILASTSQRTEYYRATGLGLNQNELSLMLTVGLAFSLLLALSERGPARLLWAGCAISTTLGSLATGSVTGALSMGALLVVSVLVGPRGRSRRPLVTTIGLLVVGGTIAFAIWTFRDLFPSRIQQAFTLVETGNFSGREDIWSAAFQYEQVWAPWGVGLGQASRLMEPLLHSSRSTHSTWVGTLVQVGYVGILLWVALLSLTFLASGQSPYRMYVRMGMIPMVVFSLSTDLAAFKVFWLMVALALARPTIKIVEFRSPLSGGLGARTPTKRLERQRRSSE